MIGVVEVIPLNRLCEGLDLDQSTDRYMEQVAEVLADNWVEGVGISEVRADELALRVRIGGPDECWQVRVFVTGEDQKGVEVDDRKILDEYRWAAAYVWARNDWAVMKPEEVEA